MKKFALVIFAFFVGATQAKEAPTVVSTIYPLQQIANAIAGEPTTLLADSQLSPHSYHLKPKDMRTIAGADILVRVGDAMMPQLHNAVKNRDEKGKITITTAQLPDIQLIRTEHTPAFDKQHKGLNYDPHLWLSTDNARVIANAIAEALIASDADNEKRYRDNLQTFNAQLKQTHQDIHDAFAAQPPRPYFIFHDAYHYFENEFGIHHAGVIRAHAAQTPRTKQLVALKQKIAETPNACLFREPQFQSSLIDKLSADTDITVATLDPVGYQQQDNGYASILLTIAERLQRCE